MIREPSTMIARSFSPAAAYSWTTASTSGASAPSSARRRFEASTLVSTCLRSASGFKRSPMRTPRRATAS